MWILSYMELIFFLLKQGGWGNLTSTCIIALGIYASDLTVQETVFKEQNTWLFMQKVISGVYNVVLGVRK